MAHLDEGAGQQEAMSQANLHATQERRHAGAVCWKVAEEVDHLWVGGHGGLQEAHEWVTVHGLDGLRLQNNNERNTACHKQLLW